MSPSARSCHRCWGASLGVTPRPLVRPRSRAESSSCASPSSTLWRSRRRRRRACGVSSTRPAFLSAAGGLTRSRRARRSASLLSDGLDSRASRRGSKDARSTVVPSDAVRRRLLAEHLLDPARAPGLRDLRGLDHDPVSNLGLHLALLPLAPPAADGPVPAGAGRRRRDRRSSKRGTKTPWTRRRGWPRSRSLFAGEAPRLARMARRWIAGFRPGSEGRASRKTLYLIYREVRFASRFVEPLYSTTRPRLPDPRFPTVAYPQLSGERSGSLNLAATERG